MTVNRPLTGRVALVTGAASGMGRAIARALAGRGAAVAVTDRDLPGAEATTATIVADGETAVAWPLDLSDPAGIAATVAGVAARLGPVAVLVNNAGISVPAAFDSDDWEAAWHQTLAVNLTGPALVTRSCLSQLLDAPGGGRVVNIASTEGLGATAGLSPYTASKHGVVGLTRALAVELGPSGVTVNCVCPGPIRTAMTAPIPDEAKERFARRRVPLRRYGQPEEVAHAVVSLVDPAASYLTGAVLTVDGGLTAKFG